MTVSIIGLLCQIIDKRVKFCVRFLISVKSILLRDIFRSKEFALNSVFRNGTSFIKTQMNCAELQILLQKSFDDQYLSHKRIYAWCKMFGAVLV